MMDLEAFLDIAKDIYRPYEGIRSIPCREKDANRQYLWMSHCTGGVRGGSCWGSERERFFSNDSTPDFTALYELYEKVCPNISFLHGKKIDSTLIQTTNDYGCADYYGNYREYLITYIHLPSLYEYMVEHNLITE